MSQLTEVPDVVVLRVTEKALLCKTPEGEEVWVPKSVVDDSSEVQEAHDEGTLVVQKWFAKKTDELLDYVD